MKIIIKTRDNHLLEDLIGIFEQTIATPTKTHYELWIVDNYIEYVEVHFSYITIHFKEKKYFNSGIRSYGIKRSHLISFEVVE